MQNTQFQPVIFEYKRKKQVTKTTRASIYLLFTQFAQYLA
jgi:hypothetical protein